MAEEWIRWERASTVGLDEGENASPGILARWLVFGEGAVEERVWGALVGDELVVNPSGVESPAKGLYVLGRDLRVGSSEEAQHGTLVARCRGHGCGGVAGFFFRHPAVEADDASEALPSSRLVEGDSATEAVKFALWRFIRSAVNNSSNGRTPLGVRMGTHPRLGLRDGSRRTTSAGPILSHLRLVASCGDAWARARPDGARRPAAVPDARTCRGPTLAS